jgi:hypothetical protein
MRAFRSEKQEDIPAGGKTYISHCIDLPKVASLTVRT